MPNAIASSFVHPAHACGLERRGADWTRLSHNGGTHSVPGMRRQACRVERLEIIRGPADELGHGNIAVPLRRIYLPSVGVRLQHTKETVLSRVCAVAPGRARSLPAAVLYGPGLQCGNSDLVPPTR